MDEALQVAVYEALTGSTALMSVITAVRDDVPQDENSGDSAQFPYVVIGDDRISAWATDDWSGGEATVRVTTHSRYSGKKETKQIMGHIRAALDRADLNISGYTSVTCDFVDSDTSKDLDGEGRIGWMDFNVLICP